MKNTVPKITNLLASNVPEASFSDWVPATSYAAGVRVYVLFSDFPEIVSYGSCIYDQFTKGSGWAYDGTNSEYDCTAGSAQLYQETSSVDSGDEFLFQFEVKNFSAGTVTPYIQGGTGTSRGADGTYQEVVTASDTDNIIGVSTSGFTGSVTNISIKKIGKYEPRDIYESQTGSNANNFPPDDDGTNWIKVSASNRYKMFDDFMTSQSENPTKISVKVKSDNCNSLSYFLVEGTTVQYIVSDDSISETSTTSITPAATDISITMTHANTWEVGDAVEGYRTSDQRAFFYGTITAWDQGTGVGTITATVFDDPAGSAPYTDWTIVKVYDYNSKSLYLEEALSWSDYFFSTIRFSSSSSNSFTFSYNTSCRVIFTGNANDIIRVGHLVVGRTSYLGDTKPGLRGSITDYSTKEANTFGEYSIVERTYSKVLRYTILIPTSGLDQVFQTLTQLRATPCVWDANSDETDFSMAIAFGFYSDFEVMTENNSISECSLEIEGLT